MTTMNYPNLEQSVSQFDCKHSAAISVMVGSCHCPFEGKSTGTISNVLGSWFCDF